MCMSNTYIAFLHASTDGCTPIAELRSCLKLCSSVGCRWYNKLTGLLQPHAGQQQIGCEFWREILTVEAINDNTPGVLLFCQGCHQSLLDQCLKLTCLHKQETL